MAEDERPNQYHLTAYFFGFSQLRCRSRTAIFQLGALGSVALVLRRFAPPFEGRVLASVLDRDRHAHVVAYSNPHALGLPIDANFMGSTRNQDFAPQFPVAHFFLFTHGGGCVLRAGRQAAARCSVLCLSP